MKKKRNYLNEFSLAFIEELQQGGMSFKFPRDDCFIENEFPHYSKGFERAMKKIYKLWKTNGDELLKLKLHLSNAVGELKANKIENEKSLRFFILKVFHDSTIEELCYVKEQAVLILKIDYDDAVCKIPYGTIIKLNFRGIENFDTDIKEFDKTSLLISDLCYDIYDGKIKLFFSGMNINDNFDGWEMSFTYEEFEIK